MIKDNCLLYTLENIDDAVNYLQAIASCSIFAFSGILGAGKSSLIKAFLKKLGVKEVITSPTYSYVNIYYLPDNRVMYHFDLYRLKTEEEFLLLGFDEYIYKPNALVFIEWPEIIKALLQKEVLAKKICYVTLEYHNSARSLQIVKEHTQEKIKKS